METSKEYIDQLSNGDEAALTQWVKDELPRLYGLCLRLSGHPQEAEDLVQDTFIRALHGMKQFKGRSTISTWLYRIAVNTWKNRIRYQSRRKFNLHLSLSGNNTGEEEEKDIDIPEQKPSPMTQLERKDTDEQVVDALNKMKEEDKSIIILRDIEQKSYEDIADVLGLNLGTVKSRLSRARDAFRQIYTMLEVKNR